MRISRNWLSKYVDLPAEDAALINALTYSGIEVEASELLPALPQTVVTARILSSEKIPETDHLQLCQVDYGAKEPAQVVCGAPNCRAGLISVLALPGAQLPQLLVRKARLKGVDSAGMLCSEKELGLSDNHAGIIELESQTPLGVPASQIYELPDTLLDLEITPNRPDLLGYLGVARDLSASLKTSLRYPEVREVPGSDTGKLDLDLVLQDVDRCPRYTARLISGVKVQDSPQWLKTALLKYGLRPINNIVDITNYVMLETGHPLHAFDYDRLQALKPGAAHPAIVVRRARPQEQFLALDGKAYELDPEDLVIADGKDASALAGVIGGKETAISETTRNIVLEAAAFASHGIRASSYKHKISTDSSYRFERQLSPALPVPSSDRATELILALAGGEVCNSLYDAYPEPVQPWYLGLRPRRFNDLIGYELSGEEIKGYLSALECEFVQYGNWMEGKLSDLSQVYCHHAEEEKAGKTEFTEIDCDHTLYFRIPFYRVDLTREADLIEEVARLAGYERIPAKTSVSRIMDRHAQRLRRQIADYFVSAGFYEVLNYSFCDPAQLIDLGYHEEELQQDLLRLVNPQSSNQSAMRLSLLPQLLANLSHNLNHGERDLKLMELSKLYLKDGSSYREPLRLTAVQTGRMWPEHWKNKAEAINAWHAKGILEGLLEQLDLTRFSMQKLDHAWAVPEDNLAYYHSGRLCAFCGRLRSEIAARFGIDLALLKQEIWVLDLDLDMLVELTRERKLEFTPLPKYPAVTRDLSFIVANQVAYSGIRDAIVALAPELICGVELFDEYEGKPVAEEKRSLSIHLCIQDKEKTLTDDRVEQLVASVWKMLADKWQVQMR